MSRFTNFTCHHKKNKKTKTKTRRKTKNKIPYIFPFILNHFINVIYMLTDIRVSFRALIKYFETMLFHLP